MKNDSVSHTIEKLLRDVFLSDHNTPWHLQKTFDFAFSSSTCSGLALKSSAAVSISEKEQEEIETTSSAVYWCTRFGRVM